jgi:hypothetical protein
MLSKFLAIGLTGLCLGNSPVAPMAEGSFEGIVKTAEAARRCGFKVLRIQVFFDDRSQIFDEGGPGYGASNANMLCLARWTKSHARRLSIMWMLREAATR